MYDVALTIDEDVAIVAVLHLQEVSKDRVARQTTHEIFPGEVGQRKGSSEELTEGKVLSPDLLEETVESSDIVEHLNDPVVRTKRDYFIGKDHAIELLLLEDVLEPVDELHGELFLLDIIACLHHQVHHPPTLQLTIDRFPLGLLDEDLSVLAEEVIQVILRLGLLVDLGVHAGTQPLALGLVLIAVFVHLRDAVLLIDKGREGLLRAFALLALLVGGE